MNNLYLKKVNPYKTMVYRAEGFCINLEIKIDNDYYNSNKYKYHNVKNLNKINKNFNLKNK